jgi:two-component system OmpR family sensor kinase
VPCDLPGGRATRAVTVADPERRLLRRTRLVLTAQLAGAITAVVLLVGGVAYTVTVSRQRAMIDQTLAYTVRHGDPGAHDPCLWLFVWRDGAIVGASGAPPGLPLRGAMSAVAGGGPGGTRTVSANDTTYTVLTARAGAEVRQAVFDERYQLSDRCELAMSLVIAELVGLVAALVTGTILAGRAMAPLGQALIRQRQFVADASHELRSPLTRLYTRMQLILRWRRADLPDGVASELASVVHGAKQLNLLVDDLLRSARLTARDAQPSRVELAAVASAVADEERPWAARRGLHVEATAGPAPTTVYGFEPALRRMVSALVDNAVRHTRPGGRVTLSVASTERGDAVELVVADTGAGFDPADRQRIFDRFASGTDGATGLGLALVREVVRDHGGTVSATGRPGAGADFRVRLPAAGSPRRRRILS